MQKIGNFLKDKLFSEERRWDLYLISLLLTTVIGIFCVFKTFQDREVMYQMRGVQVVIIVCLIFLVIMNLIFLKILKEIHHFLSQMQKPVHICFWTEIWSGKSRLGNELHEMMKGYREAADNNHVAELLMKQAELDALQSQINPHFLYNTLESIRGRALVENCEDVAEMAEALAALFRYSISRKGELVTVKEEFQNLENYLLIQQHRFHNKFKVCYNIDNPELLSAFLPRMSVQPLVENAIYHGLETKVGKGLVTVEMMEYQRRIEISIKDNGSGITDEKIRDLNLWFAQGRTPKEMRADQVGIALLNVNKRIALHFGETYGLRIYSTPGYGTDVRVTIPKKVETTGEV